MLKIKNLIVLYKMYLINKALIELEPKGISKFKFYILYIFKALLGYKYK
jgi:hypothetical protein